MSNQARSSTLGRARIVARGVLAKGENMNFTRGGALTALGLLIVAGCGGSDASPLTGPADEADSETVVVNLPDGGKVESPAPPDAPPIDGEPPPQGVFVSASKGAPANDGTSLRPVQTLAEGIALAKQKQTPLIACAETYPEHVKLVEGVTMFGYFDCANLEKWKRVTKRSVIASPSSPAVLVEGMTLITRFEGFEVRGPDFTEAGSPDEPAKTSYAMMIRGSSNLWMREVTLRSGKGQDGVDGVDPAPNRELSSTTHGGDAIRQGATCDAAVNSCFLIESARGAAGGRSQCAVAPSGGAGGAGGDGPFYRSGAVARAISTAQATGAAAPKNTPTAVGGLGGAPVTSPNALGGAGTPGQTGNVGANGEWSIGPNGLVPANGVAGTNGSPGQGGGGGGGGFYWYTDTYAPISPPAVGNRYGLAGAGGAAGGCGGVAGTAGSGGGGSIALLIVSSTDIKIVESRIEAGQGGRAGVGARGTSGLSGGVGGKGRHTGPLDQRPSDQPFGLGGGAGGAGGSAGMSGNGSAGPSIAIVYNGLRADIDQVTSIYFGQAGAGVPETTAGGKTRPAVVGIAKQEHSF